MTSRTPHFRREDVADRLLLVEVDRLDRFAAESARLQDLDAQRGVAMGALVKRIQLALADLRDLQHERFETNFRMADFADFALRATRSTGQQEEVRRILSLLIEQQTAFASQDEVLFELLDEWLETPRNIGREVTTTQLFRELREPAQLGCASLPFEFRTVKTLSFQLSNYSSTLRALYGAEERPKRSRGKAWVFHHARRSELRLAS